MARIVFAAVAALIWFGAAIAAEIEVTKDDFTGEIKRTYTELGQVTDDGGLYGPRVVLVFLDGGDGSVVAALIIRYRARAYANFGGRVVSRAGNEFQFEQQERKVITCQDVPGCAVSETLILQNIGKETMRQLADRSTEYKIYGVNDLQYTIEGARIDEWLGLLEAR